MNYSGGNWYVSKIPSMLCTMITQTFNVQMKFNTARFLQQRKNISGCWFRTLYLMEFMIHFSLVLPAASAMHGTSPHASCRELPLLCSRRCNKSGPYCEICACHLVNSSFQNKHCSACDSWLVFQQWIHYLCRNTPEFTWSAWTVNTLPSLDSPVASKKGWLESCSANSSTTKEATDCWCHCNSVWRVIWWWGNLFLGATGDQIWSTVWCRGRCAYWIWPTPPEHLMEVPHDVATP